MEANLGKPKGAKLQSLRPKGVPNERKRVEGTHGYGSQLPK